MTPQKGRSGRREVPAPALLADLGPMAQLRAGHLPRRLVRLTGGLVLFGLSLGMLVQADLGMAPWDVMHTGVARYVPLTLGQVVIVVSVFVLLLWIPLREKPGVGTVGNAVLVGLGIDAAIWLVPEPEHLAVRIALMGAGVVLNGLAGALYIGAQFGRGPRDGLMTGLSRVTGRSLRLVRTCLEIAVVVVGVLLGGALGVGTVLYAVAIGPLTQAFLPWVVVPLEKPGKASGVSGASRG